MRRANLKRRGRGAPAVLGAVIAGLVAAATRGATPGVHADRNGLVIVCIFVAAVALAFAIQRLRRGDAEKPPHKGTSI
jgi:hypothetical protein